MADASEIVDQVPVQDRDLLQRLSLYFDALDKRVRQGQGWFIFNADGLRGRRIANFIERRLNDVEPAFNSYVMAWRDFALSAYVNEVGLPQLEPVALSASPNERVRNEFRFAKNVTEAVWDRCLNSEILVVTGLRPTMPHETTFLDRAIENRYRQRLATILLTPEMPKELEAEFDSLDPTHGCWDRLFSRMYETSLVAL